MWKFLTGLFAWFRLRESIISDDRKFQRYPEQKSDEDLPRFVDRYGDRNSDLDTQVIELKVKEAVARLKSQGKF